MQNPPPVQTEQAKSSTGLDENIAALLSYVFGWISGLIFFLILSQISGVLSTIASLVSVLIWVVLSIAILVGWVMCLIKAYQSQYFKLPIIGNFAEKFSAK